MVSWHVYLFHIFQVICMCEPFCIKLCNVSVDLSENISLLMTITYNICQCIFTDAQLHLRGWKWRGSERSRGGCGSRVRCEPESSSEEPEGFRERPGRVEDEEAHAAEEDSKERLSEGLYGATASFLQCGPGLVEREEWALEDLLWPPWPWPPALAWW